MQTLVILAHPYAKSYCRALYERVIQQLEQAGHTVDRLHLDAEDFDPIMRGADLAVYARGQSADPAVAGYQARIDAAQQLVFIFPIWWELMPALLKGFLDKVFTKGWAYEPARWGLKGHLTHIQRAVIITTMNTPKWAYRWLYGNAVQRALARGTLRKCACRKSSGWPCRRSATPRTVSAGPGWIRSESCSRAERSCWAAMPLARRIG